MVSSETGQQGVCVGQEVDLGLYPLVLYPAGEPFDPALLLGPVGHLSGNHGQMGVLAAHNTTDEHGQGVYVPGSIALGLCRIE